ELGFRDSPSDPQREKRGQCADQIHRSPGVRASGADKQPDRGSKEEADAKSALEQAGAAAACVIRPEFRGHRSPRDPIARPTRNRMNANEIQSQANVLKPVMIEYVRMARIIVRLRPM